MAVFSNAAHVKYLKIIRIRSILARLYVALIRRPPLRMKNSHIEGMKHQNYFNYMHSDLNENHIVLELGMKFYCLSHLPKLITCIGTHSVNKAHESISSLKSIDAKTTFSLKLLFSLDQYHLLFGETSASVSKVLLHICMYRVNEFCWTQLFCYPR